MLKAFAVSFEVEQFPWKRFVFWLFEALFCLAEFWKTSLSSSKTQTKHWYSKAKYSETESCSKSLKTGGLDLLLLGVLIACCSVLFCRGDNVIVMWTYEPDFVLWIQLTVSQLHFHRQKLLFISGINIRHCVVLISLCFMLILWFQS